MTAFAGGAQVRELVVISGKGGTGKTSIVASFATLAKDAVLVDCDVDAADLDFSQPAGLKPPAHFRCRECSLKAVSAAFGSA